MGYPLPTGQGFSPWWLPPVQPVGHWTQEKWEQQWCYLGCRISSFLQTSSLVNKSRGRPSPSSKGVWISGSHVPKGATRYRSCIFIALWLEHLLGRVALVSSPGSLFGGTFYPGLAVLNTQTPNSLPKWISVQSSSVWSSAFQLNSFSWRDRERSGRTFPLFFPVVYVESSYQHVRCECDQKNRSSFRKFPDDLTLFRGLWLSQCLG